MNTQGLFVPPLGARQFEMKRGKYESDETFVKSQEKVVWVAEAERNRLQCPCKFCYRVIVEALPAKAKASVQSQLRKLGGHLVVCSCVGRIIE